MAKKITKTEKVRLKKEEILLKVAKNNHVIKLRKFHKLSDIRKEFKVAFNHTHK